MAQEINFDPVLLRTTVADVLSAAARALPTAEVSGA